MDKAVFYPSQTNLEPVCGPEGGGDVGLGGTRRPANERRAKVQ